MKNLFNSKLPTYTKYVYLYLDKLENRQSLSYRKIAQGCAITHRWAKHCLDELIKNGLIEIESINQSKFNIKLL